MIEHLKKLLETKNLGWPEPAKPAASYVPCLIHKNIAHISGQLPIGADGSMIKGKLGDTLDLLDGQMAAQLSAVQILAQLAAVLDDFNQIECCLNVRALVSSTPDFTQHHLVANGASELMVELLGDKGVHSRAAFGVAALPLNAAVEIEAQFAIKSSLCMPRSN